MSEKAKICPMKFTVGENIGYDCIGPKCAWWIGDDDHGCCAIKCTAQSQTQDQPLPAAVAPTFSFSLN